MTDAIRGIPLMAQDSLDFVIIVAAVLEGLRRHAAALDSGIVHLDEASRWRVNAPRTTLPRRLSPAAIGP